MGAFQLHQLLIFLSLMMLKLLFRAPVRKIARIAHTTLPVS